MDRRLGQLFEALREISSLTYTTRGHQALCGRILHCACDVLGADRAALVCIYDDHVLRYTRVRAEPNKLQRAEQEDQKRLLEWLTREPQPFHGLVADWAAPVDALGLDSDRGTLFCMPLAGKEMRLGMLLLRRDDETGAFDAQEQQLATFLAAQAAVVLENRVLYERLRLEAATDGLTGLYNYRSLMKSLRREIRSARRFETEFAFVMADVDHLKSYNERFGHIAGSQVLAEVARLLVNGCRDTDIVGKYGGDEFALILQQTGVEGARRVSERMRQAIAAHKFKHVQAGEVSCSFGIAMYPTDARDMRELIRSADEVLFRAKRAGKNLVLAAADVAAELVEPPPDDRREHIHSTSARPASVT